MTDTMDYQQHQQALAAHIRDPNQPAPAGIESRRIAVYRRLVFNNIKGFVEEAFPVLWGLWGDDKLEREVSHFMVNHRAESPYFIDIAEEFLNYLVQERQPQPDDPSFLVELAHYEWIEFEVAFCRPSQLHKPLPQGRPADDLALAVADTARVLQYQFPVHQIRRDFQPQTPAPQPVFLVVYRNADDDVKFMEINAVTARLLQFVSETPGLSVAELGSQLIALMPDVEPDHVQAGLLDILVELGSRGIVKQRVQP
ncbi:putative DNA-binding domain-containing protein [Neiella sp. HB171785]|uniref:Putative DNA-binding domain-containing protein n=1 Tax=Neiella litorisoli TaxID=2771431 RepID=A0A8J6QFS7_9GAMM|nr:putative DNA-binding domain-containing protein [Neiella litorisoli]MBD1388595.1 putative DNA-binding domain-containing protein [Neiella litorisoli]